MGKTLHKKVLVLHGPNLGKLGTREPHIYGTYTLEEINRHLQEFAIVHQWHVDCQQSNIEGVLIDHIENAQGNYDAIIINAAGLTHTSVVLRDAIAASQIPIFEVHISNIARREPFRQHSFISSVCQGTVTGFGYYSYVLALYYIISTFE